MPTTNNFYYPKGYALLIGINTYKPHFSNLSECLNDVIYWNNKFKNYYEYDYIHTMTESQATAAHIYAGIWCMASLAQPGDIVSITFSGHGLYDEDKKENFLIDCNGKFISEKAIHFLLKAFKPKVRVVIITDACNSGSFVDPKDWPYLMPSGDIITDIRDAVTKAFPAEKDKLHTLIHSQTSTTISAAVAHLAAVNDHETVGDGTTVAKTKKLSWDLGWYEIDQWRDELDLSYWKDIYHDNAGFSKVLNYVESVSANLAKYLVDYRKKLNVSSNYNMLLVLYKNNMDFAIFLAGLHAIEPNFVKQEDKERWPKILSNWPDIKRRADGQSPQVNFKGYNSQAFKKQYVFTKFSRAFYNENI